MLTVLLVGVGCFLFGIGLTRSLMRPQFCPRCGAYMKGRAREVADWLRQKREGVDGESSPERIGKVSGEQKESAPRDKNVSGAADSGES